MVNQRVAGNDSTYSMQWVSFGIPEDDGILVKVATSGLHTITLNYDHYQGAAAHEFRDFKIMYSTDSVAFTDVIGSEYSFMTASPVWTLAAGRDASCLRTFVLPPAVDGKEVVYIKITLASEYRRNGTTVPTQPTYIKLDNILVTGIPGVPTPVTLASFTATGNKYGGATLHWVAATEQGSSHYDVERSYDGKAFIKIGKVSATNKAAATYSFDDNDFISDAAYYRLRMVDIDGAFAYSKVAMVKGNSSAIDAVSVYPNPATNVLHITANDAVNVNVMSIDGKQLMTAHGATSLDVSKLSPGMYLVQIYNAATNSLLKTTKFTKQ